MVSIIYMVAGLSSRFEGKIKQFARVGLNGETLMEVSLTQAKNAGFNKIIFIVGKMTEIPFKEKFGNFWQGLPIFYAKQEFDENSRDRPWGTVDALVSALGIANEDFVVCNGDDLYGEKALKEVHNFLIKKENKKLCVSAGYELGKVIPKIGKTNRGIFKIDKENNIISINEHLNIDRTDFKKLNLTEKSSCSMNLYGLRKETLLLLKQKLDSFKNTHKVDRKAECYLPVELGNLIAEKKITVKLLPTDDSWFGITNPNDEITVREELKKYYTK